jgi:5-methylcytosine-specific restriction endonuclease McrA
MSRREFPQKVKVAVLKRAGAAGFLICEQCGGFAKQFQIDHVRPDGLGGEPTIENAQLLCKACFDVKNPADASAIARAKRLEAADLGARAKAKIPAGPSSLSTKPRRDPKPTLPRRSLYCDA